MSPSIKATHARLVKCSPSLGQHMLFHIFSCNPLGYCEHYKTHFKACGRQEQDLWGQKKDSSDGLRNKIRKEDESIDGHLCKTICISKLQMKQNDKQKWKCTSDIHSKLPFSNSCLKKQGDALQLLNMHYGSFGSLYAHLLCSLMTIP